MTERVLAQPETILPVLRALNAMGVRVFIDDFGTGFSSLGYLLEYPLEGLKMDRSFIAKLDDNSRAEMIARTVVQLAKNLNIRAIAEGIETEAQLEWARRIGCDMVQGYLLARPMPYYDCLGWFEHVGAA